MLSEQDITQLRDALAAGKPATVWFTGRAVGVDQGKSGKVVSLAEPAQGDFIEVRPTGAQDTLSFSKAELTLTRPKPTKKPAAPAKPAASAKPATPAKAAPAPTPAAPEEIYQPAPPAEKAPKPKQPRRLTRPPAEVTVTLNSTPRGDWTVDVMVGKKRSVRSLPVPAASIAKAAKELPSQVEDAISAVMAAARQQHQERIDLLQAELEAARRALNELS